MRLTAFGMLCGTLMVVACTAEHAASDGEPAHRPGAEETAGGPDAARIAGDDCVGDATITATGVGIVRIGASAFDVRQQCGGADTTFTIAEGLAERGIVLRVAGARVIALTTSGDTVQRVTFPDPGPTTAGGVGVGSSVGDVRSAHGELCPLQGEGRTLVMARTLPGVSFATSSLTAPPADTATITEVIAHGAAGC